jgi:queuine tRNA-ribosyltransferase
MRYLFHNNELLSMRLNTIHNLHFYFSLMKEIRKAIVKKRYGEFMKRFFEIYPFEEEKDEGNDSD